MVVFKRDTLKCIQRMPLSNISLQSFLSFSHNFRTKVLQAVALAEILQSVLKSFIDLTEANFGERVEVGMELSWILDRVGITTFPLELNCDVFWVFLVVLKFSHIFSPTQRCLLSLSVSTKKVICCTLFWHWFKYSLFLNLFLFNIDPQIYLKTILLAFSFNESGWEWTSKDVTSVLKHFI